MKFIILSIIGLILFGCSDLSTDTEISDRVDILKTGNKWIYQVNTENSSFCDSAEVLGFNSYDINDSISKFLYRYKEVSISQNTDSILVKLVRMDNNILYQYGYQLIDNSGFVLRTKFFSEKIPLVDYINFTNHTLYNGEYLRIESIGYEDVPYGDTTLAAIKVRYAEMGEESLIFPNQSYDIFYSDLGIVKIQDTYILNNLNINLIKVEMQ